MHQKLYLTQGQRKKKKNTFQKGIVIQGENKTTRIVPIITASEWTHEQDIHTYALLITKNMR
jgi:hypothetical protein